MLTGTSQVNATSTAPASSPGDPAAAAASESRTWVQASLLLVLTESFKVYKAISEGLINLADRFFEMDHLDAQQGLEAYKESLVANERLQVGV